MSDRLNEGLQQKAIQLVEGLESRLVGQISIGSINLKSLSFLYSTIKAAGLNPESSNDWFFIEEAAKSRKSFLASLQFPVHGDYILMPRTDTYALGVHALREKCKKEENCSHPVFTQDNGKMIYRPLTFKENLQARLEDYNTRNNSDGSVRTEEERLRLFNEWLDSCTGIAYKKGTTKFKIVYQFQDLIEIPSEFKDAFLPVDYNLIDGIELDSKDAKYNSLLTNEKVICHPAWLVAVEGDKTLLSESAGIVFSLLNEKYKRNKGMGFYVRTNTETDELRALFVDNIYIYSNAVGYINLNGNGSFLLVAPSQNFSTGSGGK